MYAVPGKGRLCESWYNEKKIYSILWLLHLCLARFPLIFVIQTWLLCYVCAAARTDEAFLQVTAVVVETRGLSWLSYMLITSKLLGRHLVWFLWLGRLRSFPGFNSLIIILWSSKGGRKFDPPPLGRNINTWWPPGTQHWDLHIYDRKKNARTKVVSFDCGYMCRSGSYKHLHTWTSILMHYRHLFTLFQVMGEKKPIYTLTPTCHPVEYICSPRRLLQTLPESLFRPQRFHLDGRFLQRGGPARRMSPRWGRDGCRITIPADPSDHPAAGWRAPI